MELSRYQKAKESGTIRIILCIFDVYNDEITKMKYLNLLCVLIYFQPAHSQSIIFPGLEGNELLDALAVSYRPTQYLTLSQARDTLYAVIDNDHGEVYTIYTDHRIFLPAGVDPSQFVFMNGDPNGINLEHVLPKSKGAGDNSLGRTDLHNFRPARTKVNSDRGSFPFKEIDDNQTQTWYYKTMEQNTIPAADIDLWSEGQRPGSFEPRESVKGDIARGLFYFYTLYQSDVLAADPDFFESMRADLCHWHLLDEVDEVERERNKKIKNYQGTDNPFILDCTLATRSYCASFDLECSPIAGVVEVVNTPDVHIRYEPLTRAISIRSGSQGIRGAKLSIMDALGHIVFKHAIPGLFQGAIQVALPSSLAAGIYFVSFGGHDDGAPFNMTDRLIIHD